MPPLKPLIIIDFGSQYTMLIARRIRELHIYCEVVSSSIKASDLQAKDPVGIILSGSHNSTTTKDLLDLDWVWDMQLPILGICFGMQWMVQKFAGVVAADDKKEFGSTVMNFTPHEIFVGIPEKPITVWMSHGDKATSAPKDFDVIASSKTCAIAAIAHKNKPIFGCQFHPEVTHSEYGTQILHNFAINICKASTSWVSKTIAKNLIDEIKEKVGDQKVLLALSGGVDSSVVAALLKQAVGDNLVCVFIDNGLLRLNEREQVEKLFGETFKINLTVIDASELFLTQLKSVSNPEQKRKIIGKCFIDEFAKFSNSIAGDVAWLAQGTIYPDVIESSSGKHSNSATIKSHHNVGGLPKDLPFKLLEPIRMLFKDEVRAIGLELGLPAELLQRHPFPGPGLAVRIAGAVELEYCHILQQADAIFMEELINHNWYKKVAQAFAVFLPVKAVGVAGDARIYGYTISLRAVITTDFMTAKFAFLPAELLEIVSSRIMNEVSQVARVLYDISSKPPATIEWE